MEEMVAERQAGGAFTAPFDFARRLDNRVVNKRQLENLVRAGAFDSLVPNRKSVFDGIEMLLRHASAAASERHSDQIGLFAAGAVDEPVPPLPSGPDWPPIDRLKQSSTPSASTFLPTPSTPTRKACNASAYAGMPMSWPRGVRNR